VKKQNNNVYMKKDRTPTIYIAGPMRGIEGFNFPAFDRQAKVLREQGWVVINPAEIDRELGSPSSDPMEYDPVTNYEDHEFMRVALKRDTSVICDDCTAMYMMAKWEISRGALAEWHLAKALGLDMYYEAPLPYPED
tara:strand:+ start:716 stop:1126 length:411 start_codon:yes stop_codon:yes gene_type:complete